MAQAALASRRNNALLPYAWPHSQALFSCVDNYCIYNYYSVMKNKPISNLEDHFGYWLRTLSNFVHHSFAERLEKYDVSVAQWVVLRTLYDTKELSLNEAADMIGVDKSSLSRMVERLVQRQLVHRIGCVKDRRSVMLSLSDAARELVPLLAKEADQNDKEFFNSLGKNEQKLLLQTIHQLLSANGWQQSSRGWDTMQ